MNKTEFFKLLDKYLANETSPEEEQLLMDVYQTFQKDDPRLIRDLGDLDLIENRLLKNFANHIALSTNGNHNAAKQKLSFYKSSWLKIAACFFVFFGLAVIWWTKQNTANEFESVLVHKTIVNFISITNNTALIKRVNFPDGSYVDLNKGSKIGYNQTFTGTKREVFLIGDGFFQVAKNPAKPFIVYTSRLVAKVLGTSFFVKSGQENGVASVLVKTGRVSVFKRNEFTDQEAKANLTDGVVLTPNLKAALGNNQLLERKIAEHPDLLKNVRQVSFDFDNTPVSSVFKLLQSTYGINIIYDKDKFSACSISVKMGAESFYQKLNLICETLNASYQTRDGNIYINGAGCQKSTN